MDHGYMVESTALQINLELFAIVAALASWGHQWRRKKILVYRDNQAIVQVWQAKNPKHPAIAQVCRTLFLVAAKK